MTSPRLPARHRRARTLGTLAALALVAPLAACGGEAQPSGENLPPTSQPPESITPTTPPAEGGVAQRQVISLPDGFQPEGITSTATTAYVGSLADGQILSIDLGSADVTPVGSGDGTPSVGLDVEDDERLWVAGGEGGDLRVLDPSSGDELGAWQLAPQGEAFINDVIVGVDAAYATDSMNARIFVLPLVDNALPASEDVVELALSGDWEQGDGFGANGIVTSRDGEAVLVVNSGSGNLYRVPVPTAEGQERPDDAPEPGAAIQVDLGGADLTNGDGMLREGRTLYVVRNRDNLVAELLLGSSGENAQLQAELSSPEFDVPTTVALADGVLYLPNAKFGNEDPSGASYEVVLVPQP